MKRTAGCCLALALTAGAALIIVGVVLLALVFFARSSSGSQPGEASSTVGVERPAPDFTLPDLNGAQVSLAQFRGQPVVVNFWATWCPPCREEIPRLAEAYRREKDGGVVFIAISDEPASVVGPFVEKNAIPYINLIDSGDRVSSAYGIRGLPTTLFISRDGEIEVYYTGGMSARIIEEGLRRIKEP